jgi:Zn-dependent protease with chaperone function
LGLPLILTGMLLGCAWFLYLRHPGALRRKFSLEPFAEAKDPAFAAEVISLCRVAGISPAPKIEMRPDLRSQSGQAFGLGGQFSLRLDAGLRSTLRKAPEKFRALVLHELGHLANGDVARTYFAQSLWISVVFMILAPLAIASVFVLVRGQAGNFDATRLFTRNLPALLSLWFKGAMLIAVFAFVRARLLRARENYADWRAAIWGAAPALKEMLRTSAEAWPLRSAGLKSWFALHPPPAQRLAALDNPALLFCARWELALVVGVLLGLTIEGTFPMVTAIALGSTALLGGQSAASAAAGNPSLAYVGVLLSFVLVAVPFLIGFFVVGWLVAGTVGLQVQRSAVAKLAAGNAGGESSPLWQLALALALGCEIGFLSITGVNGVHHFRQIPAALALSTALAVWFWLCLLFVEFAARSFVARHTGNSFPRRRMMWTTIASSVLAGTGIIAILLLRFAWLSAALRGSVDSTMVQIGLGAGISAVILYALVFGVQFLLGSISSPRCGICHQSGPSRVLVGQQCASCGSMLTPWLFHSEAGRAATRPSPPALPIPVILPPRIPPPLRPPRI